MGAEAQGARGVPGARAQLGLAAMASRGFRGASVSAQAVGTPRGTQGVLGARGGSGPRGAPRGLGRMCGGLSFKRVASQRRRFPRGSAPGRVRISACGRAGGSRPPSVAYAEGPGFPRPADLGGGEEMRPFRVARGLPESQWLWGKLQGGGLVEALCNCGGRCGTAGPRRTCRLFPADTRWRITGTERNSTKCG